MDIPFSMTVEVNHKYTTTNSRQIMTADEVLEEASAWFFVI